MIAGRIAPARVFGAWKPHCAQRHGSDQRPAEDCSASTDRHVLPPSAEERLADRPAAKAGGPRLRPGPRSTERRRRCPPRGARRAPTAQPSCTMSPSGREPRAAMSRSALINRNTRRNTTDRAPMTPFSARSWTASECGAVWTGPYKGYPPEPIPQGAWCSKIRTPALAAPTFASARRAMCRTHCLQAGELPVCPTTVVPPVKGVGARRANECRVAGVGEMATRTMPKTAGRAASRRREPSASTAARASVASARQGERGAAHADDQHRRHLSCNDSRRDPHNPRNADSAIDTAGAIINSAKTVRWSTFPNVTSWKRCGRDRSAFVAAHQRRVARREAELEEIGREADRTRNSCGDDGDAEIAGSCLMITSRLRDKQSETSGHDERDPCDRRRRAGVSRGERARKGGDSDECGAGEEQARDLVPPPSVKGRGEEDENGGSTSKRPEAGAHARSGRVEHSERPRVQQGREEAQDEKGCRCRRRLRAADEPPRESSRDADQCHLEQLAAAGKGAGDCGEAPGDGENSAQARVQTQLPTAQVCDVARQRVTARSGRGCP